MSNSASSEVLWLISIKALKVSINLALWSIFQCGHKHWSKYRKICQSNLLMDRKVESNFQLIDWWTVFQPNKFLKLKIIHLNSWIDRKIVINFHMKGNYPSQKINWKKYEYFKKSNFIHLQKPFNSWNILALGYLGH